MEKRLLVFIILSCNAMAAIYVDCDFEVPPTSEDQGGTYTCDVNTATLFFASNLAGPVFDHTTDEGWRGSGAARFYTHTSGSNSYRQLDFGSYSATEQQNLRFLIKYEPGISNELGGKWHLADGAEGWRAWYSMASRGQPFTGVQPSIAFDNTIWMHHGNDATVGECNNHGYQCCQHPETWWADTIVSCSQGTTTPFRYEDYEDQWVVFEIERHRTGEYKVYIWTQDGAFGGLYYELDTTYDEGLGNAPLGAYLEGEKTGRYFIFDEVVVADEFVGPPEGFLNESRSGLTCSQSDVEAAIESASPGSTVNVPAGSCTWSGMSIDKPVHIRGAGIGRSVIEISDNTITKSSGIIRISGFSFTKTGGGTQSKGIFIDGPWDAEPVIIENNEFTISDSGLISIASPGGVVIAGNTFTGGWDDSFIQPKESLDIYDSWGTADTMGDRDTTGRMNIYVEGNTFYGGANQGIDCDDSCRCVYRYNNLTYSSFNSHGMASSPVGIRHFEVYNNRFMHDQGTGEIANQNWAVWIRGGTGVIFENYMDDLAGSYWGEKPEIRLTIRGAEDDRPQGSCSQVQYPVPHQLGQSHDGTSYTSDPIYIWGNTGTNEIESGWAWGNPCGFDYSDFFQWGRDAVQGQKPGYEPYTYPHPLRTGAVCIPMSVSELISVIDQWRAGTTNINQVMQGIVEWKSGCS